MKIVIGAIIICVCFFCYSLAKTAGEAERQFEELKRRTEQTEPGSESEN